MKCAVHTDVKEARVAVHISASGGGVGGKGGRGWVGALHIRMGLPAGLFAREVLQPMFEVRLAGVCGRLTFPLFSEKLPQTLLWFVLTFILHLGFRFSLCFGRRSGGTLSYPGSPSRKGTHSRHDFSLGGPAEFPRACGLYRKEKGLGI